MTQLGHQETLTILNRAHEAFQAGDHTEYVKISQLIPLAPHIAKATKETLGATYLKNSGFDLSEAEAVYGHNWLDE